MCDECLAQIHQHGKDHISKLKDQIESLIAYIKSF
jgi:hypothetical protein